MQADEPPTFEPDIDRLTYKRICHQAEQYKKMLSVDDDTAMIMAGAFLRRPDLVEDNILNLRVENDALAEAVKQCTPYVPYDTRGQVISLNVEHFENLGEEECKDNSQNAFACECVIEEE